MSMKTTGATVGPGRIRLKIGATAATRITKNSDSNGSGMGLTLT